MKDKVTHDLAGFIASGWQDTGVRIVAGMPSWSAQVQHCRRLNIACDYTRTLRVSLEPDTWALITTPEYAGQLFAEPGALLP